MNIPQNIKSLWQKINTRPHRIIFGIIFCIFIVSANMAWLNPNPELVVKTDPKIPIFWQYNGDSTVEFLSAAYFPTYFRVDKTRTNRPLYPAIVRTLGEIIGFIASPFIKMGILLKAIIAYVTLKFFVYLAGALSLYYLVKRWLPEKVALLTVPLVFFHPFAVTFIGTFHTSELQFITPIFLIALWLNLGDAYSTKKNIVYSLIVGFLMLAKEDYAVYLAILVFSFFILKKYKESVLSVVVHLIPLCLWLIALKMLHIPYYNHETESANQGVWLYQDLIFRNPIEIIKTLIEATASWLGNIVGYFNFFAFAALFSLSFPEIRSKFNRRYVLFSIIFLSTVWLQSFAANRYAPYMASDLVVLIFPLAAYSLYRLFEHFRAVKYITVFCIIYLFLGLTTLIHFPWISPYNQVDITHPDRVQLLQEGKLVPRGSDFKQ